MYTETKSTVILKNFTNTKNSYYLKNNFTTGTKRGSLSLNNKAFKDTLPKIGKINLFSSKKSGSQIYLKKENIQKSIANIHIEKKDIKNLTRSINNKREFIFSKDI